MRIPEPLPEVTNVNAGYTALIKMPIGKTYHGLDITYSGLTLANMEDIRVFANGKMIQRWDTGTYLDKVNTFSGRAAASGVLSLDFDRHKMKTRAGQELTAIGTGHKDDPMPITELRAEIDIAAAASSPALSVSAIRSDPTVLNLIKKVEHRSYNAAATGEFVISDLSLGDLINRLIFVSSSISKIKIERDGRKIFERTTAENTKNQTDGGFRTPQTGYWIVDATELGFNGEEIATLGVQDFRITLTMSATGAIPMIIEWIGPLGS